MLKQKLFGKHYVMDIGSIWGASWPPKMKSREQQIGAQTSLVKS